jgi:hypothetical protein
MGDREGFFIPPPPLWRVPGTVSVSRDGGRFASGFFFWSSAMSISSHWSGRGAAACWRR